MKLIFTLLILLYGITCAPAALAEEAYYNDLTIGEPARPAITNDQLAKGRAIATANAELLLRDPRDIVVGNPHGSVTLVQFIDFLCTLTQRMDPNIQALIRANPDLRVVYKPYPLRGSLSVTAAKFTLAANREEGKYLPLHVAILGMHSEYDENKLLALAKAQGLNTAAIKQAMNNPVYTKMIADTVNLAKKIGVPGTPVLFFAKTTFTSDENPNLILYMLGQFDKEDLQKALNKILAEE